MGFHQATTADITTVSTIVRVPLLQLLTTGATLQAPLSTKLATMA